ncbi:MAG: PEP-CTERM sorting domain-containing protein [Okeania sp. SIO3B5]|uniref:PEP-CTERM sorting domain-containing protein n=1 Tax=Okeania sp. SIO3B5 TaxID=2607811 RepID=UPI0013FFE618|nr:PEP-CTERM sorting domain-containing protein [Okeania sp. SIO3B5]NEO57738.1 PEP-CTERM sorting domain-containing protein [Okeania sp. SIO3B5]
MSFCVQKKGVKICSTIGFVSALLGCLTLIPKLANAASIGFQGNDSVIYREQLPSDPLWVWDAPCGNGYQGQVYNGHQGTVLSSNYSTISCYGGTYDWYNVSFNGGPTGWVAGDFLFNDYNQLSINGNATVRTEIGDSLYVWSQPGGGQNVGFLQPGTQVTVRERGPVMDVFGGTYNWFRVDQGWVAGEFLQSNTSISNPIPIPAPNPVPLPPPPPRPPTASLVFVDDNDWRIPGLDHVGLEFNGLVYESVPSRGVTKHRKPEDMEITRELSLNYDLATAMERKIQEKINQGAGYADLTPFIHNLHPFFQKGGLGQFTCVGLIEWAAEKAGHRGGQGFISWWNEYISLGWKTFSTLTPSLLYWSQKNPFIMHDAVLHGFLDPVDFILTDPLGRQFGYTEELGLIEEIPGAFYTGDGWAEQFLISGLTPGDYTLQLFGLDDEANVAFGNSTGGASFSGYLERGETHTLVFTVATSVPESSTTLGLLAVGAIGASSLLKRRL